MTDQQHFASCFERLAALKRRAKHESSTEAFIDDWARDLQAECYARNCWLEVCEIANPALRDLELV